ncbi:MAG: flavin prenyltransferase UbiX [Planctomycetota bacterium]|nr:flavin prenyltransferase UbiX [Planctomycetota bacterium]
MKPLVVAMTGASGAPYAIRLLELLAGSKIPVHLTISPAGAQVLKQESNRDLDLDHFEPGQLLPRDVTFENLVYHDYRDFMVPIASGSFQTRGMVVVPCSGSTLGGIASGASSNLIHRAAEVHLKESRKLVLVTRETPLSLIHINNLKTVAEAGATVLPAMPGWYHGVKSTEDLVDFVVARILDQFDIQNQLIHRWGDRR